MKLELSELVKYSRHLTVLALTFKQQLALADHALFITNALID